MDQTQHHNTTHAALSSRIIGAGIVLALLGAILTAVAFFMGGDPRRILFSLLLNFSFFLSIALGALCWVTLHHLTRAGWSVSLRRMGEAVGASIPVLSIAGILLLLFLPSVYRWANADLLALDLLTQKKTPYLNIPFFTIRFILFFAIWIGIGRFFLSRSRRQDQAGDALETVRMERFSPAAMILLALSITFFSIDFLMSLDPHWFSTVFGVYFFSGCMAGFFSLLALVALGLRRRPEMERLVTVEQLHDVGKLIFTFVVFWAYIAFSQYMLIWYSNIPEETIWLARRQNGQWMGLTYALLIGHFIIPFLGLMSRWPKRSLPLLGVWAVWMLVMHWFDLYWIIVPEYRQDSPQLGLALSDLTTFLMVCGLFLTGSALPLRKSALTPVRDPRLDESLAFENM